MYLDATLSEQLDRQRYDPLRILIVGAGVAGVTVAQSLRAAGLNPVLIEREGDNADPGYMIALMPIADPILRKLGVQETYRRLSQSFHRYRIHGRHGQLIREYEIDALLSKYGDYRGLSRGNLLNVLGGMDADVSYKTTLRAIQQDDCEVHTTLQDGAVLRDAHFDAVVLADGLHSSSREMILKPDEVATYDSRWGGWVVWLESANADADTGDEVWGTDFFIGIYPVKGRAGVFVGGSRNDMQQGPAHFVRHIRSRLRICDARLDRALSALEREREPYFWKLTDCRSARWAVGRVALVGDAAAGFLPTAGIGAAMAIESAGVLVRLIGRADRCNVGAMLREYERKQRPRVEAAQENSRQLARMMFNHSSAFAAMRDILTRFLSLRVALRPIRRLLDTSPGEV